MQRRALTRALALLPVTSLALPLAELTPAAEAKSKTLTFSNTSPIAIPGSGTEGNASPFPSTIQVSGFKKGKLQDVNVTINNFSHAGTPDVGILVQAPNGHTALLLANAGDGAVSNLNITFDDNAAAPLVDGVPLISGTFRPSVFDFPSDSTAPFAPLADLNGSPPNGTWSLFVFDDASGDTGSIAGGWSLQIQATVQKKKRKKKK
jgi:subtilisin-like proprotein convertase family protein